jgi:hypothetical protein
MVVGTRQSVSNHPRFHHCNLAQPIMCPLRGGLSLVGSARSAIGQSFMRPKICALMGGNVGGGWVAFGVHVMTVAGRIIPDSAPAHG